MKPTSLLASPYLALVLVSVGCAAEDGQPCTDVPPWFREAVVVVAAPQYPDVVSVPGDDRTLLAWGEETAHPGLWVLRARCVGPDGATAGTEAAVLVEGRIQEIAAARSPGGRYRLVYGAWAATAPTDPVAHFAVDVDCIDPEPVPRAIRTPEPDAFVSALVAVGPWYAFLRWEAGATWLALDDAAAGVRLVPVEACASTRCTLAVHDDAIAFVAVRNDGMKLTTYGTDGTRRAGPIQVAGSVVTYAPRACWDGGGWSIAASTRDQEVAYARVDADGVVRVLAQASDGAGESYDPSIACGDGRVVIALRRHHPEAVSETGLDVATIEMVELGTDGIAVHGPLEVEPPVGRLSLFPTIATERGVTATWASYGANGYEHRMATTGDRCE